MWGLPHHPKPVSRAGERKRWPGGGRCCVGGQPAQMPGAGGPLLQANPVAMLRWPGWEDEQQGQGQHGPDEASDRDEEPRAGGHEHEPRRAGPPRQRQPGREEPRQPFPTTVPLFRGDTAWVAASRVCSECGRPGCGDGRPAAGGGGCRTTSSSSTSGATATGTAQPSPERVAGPGRGANGGGLGMAGPPPWAQSGQWGQPGRVQPQPRSSRTETVHLSRGGWPGTEWRGRGGLDSP